MISNWFKRNAWSARLCLIVAGTVVLGAASGCMHRKGYDEESESSGKGVSFTVQALEAESLETSLIDSSWDIPTEKSFGIKACLAVSGIENVSAGRIFEIRPLGKWDAAVQKAVTYADGCLHWRERVVFNFFSLPTAIETHREIVGIDGLVGRQTVSFSLNPWARTLAESVVDLRSGNRGIALGELNAKGSARVVVEQAAVRIGEPGVALKLVLNARIDRADAAGRWFSEPEAQGGKFLLRLKLFERAKDGTRTLLCSAEEEVRRTHGKITLIRALHIGTHPADSSRIELVFQLEPIEAPLGVLGTEGLVELRKLISDVVREPKPVPSGQSDSANKSVPSRVTPEQEASFEGCLIRHGSTVFDFDVFRAEFDQARRVRNGARPLSRVTLHLTACMRDPSDFSPLSSVPFDVNLSGSPSQQKTSDAQGCVSWDDHLDFDPHTAGHYLERYLVVRGKQEPFTNTLRAIKVGLDPWRSNGIGVWDCRRGSIPKESLADGPRLEIKQGSMIDQGERAWRFTLNSQLALGLKQTYQIELNPVLRLKNPGAAESEEPAPDGAYRIRAMVLAVGEGAQSSDVEDAISRGRVLQLDPQYRFASYAEGDFQAVNGRIEGKVEFEFEYNQLPLLANGGQIVLELSPVKRAAIAPVAIVSRFLPVMTVAPMASFRRLKLELRELNRSLLAPEGVSALAKIASDAAAKRAERERATDDPVKVFQLASGMKAGDANFVRAQSTRLSASEWDAIVEHSADPSQVVQMKLCYAFYSKLRGSAPGTRGSDLQSCVMNPSKYLRISRSTHVVRVLESPQFLGASEGEFKTAAKFTLAQEALPQVGGLIHSWATDLQWFRSIVLTTSDAEKLWTKPLVVPGFRSRRLDFELQLGTRHCINIQKRIEQEWSSGELFCSNREFRETRRDSWFYLSTRSDSLGREWVKVMRGEHRFRDFENLVTDTRRTFILREDVNWRKSESTIPAEPLSTDGLFPGLL